MLQNPVSVISMRYPLTGPKQSKRGNPPYTCPITAPGRTSIDWEVSSADCTTHDHPDAGKVILIHMGVLCQSVKKVCIPCTLKQFAERWPCCWCWCEHEIVLEEGRFKVDG